MPAIELIFIDGIRNKLEFIKGANKKKKEKKKYGTRIRRTKQDPSKLKLELCFRSKRSLKKRKKISEGKSCMVCLSSRTNALTPRKR